MGIHEFVADGHTIRIDEDRLESIRLGNGDPGGDGPIATCDGVEMPIEIRSDDLPNTSGDNEQELVMFGSNGDDSNRQVDAIAGVSKTEGYTTAPAYDAGTGEPVSEEDLPDLLEAN